MIESFHTAFDEKVPRPHGRIERVLLKLVAQPAVIAGVERLGERFRRITVSGDGLRGARWSAGDKVCLKLGGFASRAYTPIGWNPSVGSLRLIVYLHGEPDGGDSRTAPATVWARCAAAGDACMLSAPRPALRLDRCIRNAVFFGDETSFASAAAFQASAACRQKICFVFELSEPGHCAAALSALRLDDAVLIRRAADDRHLDGVEGVIERLASLTKASDLVLTGKSSSVDHLLRSLQRRGRSAQDILTCPHWGAR